MPSHSCAIEPIRYEIHDYSSAATTYQPHNILNDEPMDEGSRWTSSSSDQSQFLCIKLHTPSVVKLLCFGKFHKPHVCNLREFRVFGGMEPQQMMEMFHGGLENSDLQEQVAVRYKTESGVVVPIQFIKIVPHSSYQKEFPYSIWYLEVQGIQQVHVVNQFWVLYEKWRETEALRQCLKFLRQSNLHHSFQTLSRESQCMLEDPMLSNLHQTLVFEQNYEKAEEMVEIILKDFQIQEYINEQHWAPRWKKLSTFDEYGNSPRMRGGHQMTICHNLIILFGGWDGQREMNDLWMFKNKWVLLSPNTQLQGGPGPRSCHKMVYEPKSKNLYILGRFFDKETRPAECDFWSYNVESNEWTLLSLNTHADNGPYLVYDHQMCLDPTNLVIYVFGGKALVQDQSPHSGLYSYSIMQRQWKLLCPENQTLLSRVGHFLLFHERQRCLLILGGQRHKEMYRHFLQYNVDTNKVIKLPLPEMLDTSVTQRACLDESTQTLLVFSNLLLTPSGSSNPCTFLYNLVRGTWHRILCLGIQGEEYPTPRFAYQVVHDSETQTIYVFGGNPDLKDLPHIRLDDFWMLNLHKVGKNEVLSLCRFLIRKQKFISLCQKDCKIALEYLQNKVSEVVDHDHPVQVREFMQLTNFLFVQNLSEYSLNSLYDRLISFFPKSMKQPICNLQNLIPLC